MLCKDRVTIINKLHRHVVPSSPVFVNKTTVPFINSSSRGLGITAARVIIFFPRQPYLSFSVLKSELIHPSCKISAGLVSGCQRVSQAHCIAWAIFI